MAAGMAPLANGAWDISSIMPRRNGDAGMPANFPECCGGQGGCMQVMTQISAYDTTGLQAMINRMMPQLGRSLQSYQSLKPSTT
jgi:hypothetical protein